MLMGEKCLRCFSAWPNLSLGPRRTGLWGQGYTLQGGSTVLQELAKALDHL